MQADSLEKIIPEGSFIASNSLAESYSLAYILGVQSYGVVHESSDIKETLLASGVDYFLCINEDQSNCGLGPEEPVWQGAIDKYATMRVYKIE